MENQSADHVAYEEACQDYDDWLEEAQRKVDDINPKCETKQELDDNVADVAVSLL